MHASNRRPGTDCISSMKGDRPARLCIFAMLGVPMKVSVRIVERKQKLNHPDAG